VRKIKTYWVRPCGDESRCAWSAIHCPIDFSKQKVHWKIQRDCVTPAHEARPAFGCGPARRLR
jgi:hypothetical protein